MQRDVGSRRSHDHCAVCRNLHERCAARECIHCLDLGWSQRFVGQLGRWVERCYMDDIMVIYADTIPMLNRINMYMKLKVDSVGDPDLYLSAKLGKLLWRMITKLGELAPRSMCRRMSVIVRIT